MKETDSSRTRYSEWERGGQKRHWDYHYTHTYSYYAPPHLYNNPLISMISTVFNTFVVYIHPLVLCLSGTLEVTDKVETYPVC